METIIMAYSDHILKPVLIELSQSGAVTCSQIAEHTNIPYGTVKRAVDRLVSKNEIRRVGLGRKWGYRYELTER